MERFTRITRLVTLLLGGACVAHGAPAQSASRVFGDSAVWHRAPSRTYHVEHYTLGLRFDERAAEVFGNETVTLRPFAPRFRTFHLDSDGLAIDSVWLESAHGEVALSYARRDPRLWITLHRDYDTGSVVRVRIVYHGHPRTGLFFVNPTTDYPKWPSEVYSQGEPEFNHYWFPCWDYPNDMATSETITTVPEGQRVVSNGTLVRVTRGAGVVTYDWVERVPHSSYLISIAVGPWRKVSDRYGDNPVDYYVPPGVDDATSRRSFHLTPDMIGFFSRATGVPYPYEQYAQTTVKNYPFGGQENVSATTLTDATLHDARADADYPSTQLVAHELGQHWFGDYVQANDWADIWLNEGFATYMEALYTQYHEGNDAFRLEMRGAQHAERAEERDAYRRAIVDRHYADPLDMFDATTHEKGAAVLDMLRYVVDGPRAASRPASQHEALFLALHHYLVTHRTRTATTGDVVEAIREATGLELGWFFREWVYMAGQPEYRVAARWDTSRRVEEIRVVQTQASSAPVFDMPIELAFHGSSGEQRLVQVRDSSRDQVFEVPLAFAPRWVDFDPDDFIDKTLVFPQPLDALVAEAEDDPEMMSRLWAAEQLGAANDSADLRAGALSRVLHEDSFYGVRAAAAAALGALATDSAKEILLPALSREADSRVRAAIASALSRFGDDRAVFGALAGALRSDSSYAVESAAAAVIGASGDPRAFDVLRAEAARNPEIHVMQATLAALAATNDRRAAEILLADAAPGIRERIRLAALGALAASKAGAEGDHAELVAAVRSALGDPYLLVRLAGERLVAAYGLSEFRSDVERDATAPLALQREIAQRVLDQLSRSGR